MTDSRPDPHAVRPGTVTAGDLIGLARRASERLSRFDGPALAPPVVTRDGRAPTTAPPRWLPPDARALRAGEVTSLELVERGIARMDHGEPVVAALLARMDDTARAAAVAEQRALDAGVDRGLVHGLPVVIKDLIDVAGVATTAASPLLADFVPDRDAPVVAALRRAGAIVVAKANTHEFAFGALTPPTRNPWDPTRMPGGSSGGSAAAVAAGYAPMALGTDTAGSVREPAALCGVVGLKPTFGRVSVEGVVPLAWTLDTVGPMGLTVADAAALWGAMAPAGAPVALPRKLDGLRVGVVRELCDPLQSELHDAFARVRGDLADGGCVLSDVTIGDADELLGAVIVVLGAEAASYHRRWFTDRRDAYGADVQAYLDLSATFTAAEYVDAQRVRGVLADHIDVLLSEVDVLLTPSQSVVAPEVEADHVEFPGGRRGARDLNLIRPLAPFNLSGHPALSVPVAVTDAGLPFSVQLVGPRYADESLFDIGALVQAVVGWQPRLPEIGAASQPASERTNDTTASA